MFLSIPFPYWLKPEIIPGLPVRWYGLMYVAAFAVAFILYRRQVKERNFPLTEDEISALFFWVILALVFGARIFSTLVYEGGSYYLRNPWLIFWPFRDGRFTGLQGMSYHGGVIGGALSVIIYSKIKKYDYREIGDMYAASIPLGYSFGRLGNFINGELYGRITTSPLGMIFPQGGIYPRDPDYAVIRSGAAAMGFGAGDTDIGGILNYPRHPSQLYEMLFEGIVLWAIIWFFRNRKPFKGFLVSLYLCGYGFFRFFIEYFREPDSGMGYPVQLVKTELPPALGHPLLCFSTGQILCFLMILAGLAWAFAASRMGGSGPVRIYTERGGEKQGQSSEEKAAGRNRRRKLRKKLRSE
jgi:phosphatidylglycerol:prolipoprotein diacylglycerol transferase